MSLMVGADPRRPSLSGLDAWAFTVQRQFGPQKRLTVRSVEAYRREAIDQELLPGPREQQVTAIGGKPQNHDAQGRQYATRERNGSLEKVSSRRLWNDDDVGFMGANAVGQAYNARGDVTATNQFAGEVDCTGGYDGDATIGRGCGHAYGGVFGFANQAKTSGRFWRELEQRTKMAPERMVTPGRCPAVARVVRPDRIEAPCPFRGFDIKAA